MPQTIGQYDRNILSNKRRRWLEGRTGGRGLSAPDPDFTPDDTCPSPLLPRGTKQPGVRLTWCLDLRKQLIQSCRTRLSGRKWFHASANIAPLCPPDASLIPSFWSALVVSKLGIASCTFEDRWGRRQSRVSRQPRENGAVTTTGHSTHFATLWRPIY